MKFLPLMALSLTHAYYPDGLCRDFWIEPTPATQKLLQNYRCLLKMFPSGVRILAPVTEQGTPFILLPPSLTFTFQLRIQNPDFAIFTDLTELAQIPAPLYTNVNLGPGQPVQLTLASRRAWTTESFMVGQPAQEDRYVLGGCPLAGSPLADFKVEGLGTKGNVKRYEAVTKIITVNSAAAKQGDPFIVTYETTPQRARDVLAEVEIHANDSLPEISAGPAQFQVAFAAKQARWKYYIIADGSATNFQIEDKGTSPIKFSPANWTDLNQQPDPMDGMAQTLAAQYPTMQRFRFVSDDPVPCRQMARKSIQLRCNGHQVMGNLPNPALRNFSTFQGIKNGKPSQEEVFFQVVKCFTH